MEIYILRHAIAEDHRPGRRDQDRALTEEGRKKLRPVLERARSARVEPSLILTSPYVRAVQTAEMAAEALGYKGTLVRTETLVPGSVPQAAWLEIREHRGEKAILLAGHEPLLSAIAAYLLGAPGMAIEFKKGALLRIDVDASAREPRGTLQWLVTPKLAGA
ncbi:MAG TPA: phosphohistidine phosphatase SixA [Bryobacteraceae bacterium]|nr:phosphohistidine phosphatase SixA [Bryobacteraceae bacterium]